MNRLRTIYLSLLFILAMNMTNVLSVYSRADISAILYIAVDCMREMLLEGKKIRLGDLGDFSLLLTSKGAEDADKFTAQNITGVKVQWEPGQYGVLSDKTILSPLRSLSLYCLYNSHIEYIFKFGCKGNKNIEIIRSILQKKGCNPRKDGLQPFIP